MNIKAEIETVWGCGTCGAICASEDRAIGHCSPPPPIELDRCTRCLEEFIRRRDAERHLDDCIARWTVQEMSEETQRRYDEALRFGTPYLNIVHAEEEVERELAIV